MKVVSILILSSFIIIGCKHSDAPPAKLYELYKEFTKNQISHFPLKGNVYAFKECSYLMPIEGTKENKGAYLKVMYSLKRNEFKRLEVKLRDEGIKKATYSDKCNILIERGSSQDRSVKPDSCDEWYPIPVFWEEIDYFNTSDHNSLPDDFKLYIIEANHGIFLKKEFLSNEMPMPRNWRHGISRGVALSKKRLLAIFWVDIW